MKKRIVWVWAGVLLGLGWVGSNDFSGGADRSGRRLEPLSEEGVVWAHRYDSHAHKSDVAYAVAADGSGNAVVTGGSLVSLHNWNYATIKYGPRGGRKWLAHYSFLPASATSSKNDLASAIMLDKSGNAYVTGESAGTGGWPDFATIKYDANGNVVWTARTYWVGPKKSDNKGKAITLDYSGNVIVAGTTYITALADTTKHDFLTVKYDAGGHEMWKRRFDGGAHQDDFAVGVGTDGRKNVYVMGRSMERSWYRGQLVKHSDFRLVKYDQDGTLLWSVHRNSEGVAADKAHAAGLVNRIISMKGVTELFLTGSSKTNAAGYDFYTIKMDADGGIRWEKRIAEVSGMTDIEAKAMAVHSSGSIYVAGGSSCSPALFITVKYDQYGNPLWTRTFDAGLGFNHATAIAVDDAGDCYVTGNAQYNSLASYDYATVKYDTNGNEKWTRRYSYAVKGYDWPRAIAVDNKGYVYVTGSSEGVDTREDYLTVKYRAD